MPELLAALCSLILATGVVASSPQSKDPGSQPATPPAAAAQKKAAGKKAQEAQTPLQKARALLEKIKALEEAENASDNTDERVNLLEGADKLCDDADAAATDAEGKRAAFDVRYKLANRVFLLEAWDVGVALYSDALPYAIGEWGPEFPFTLGVKGGFASCLAGAQRSKPWDERDYKPALEMKHAVADAQTRRLTQVLAAEGEGPLEELAAAAEAGRNLGITLFDSGHRPEAKDQLLRVHDLVCEQARRLRDEDVEVLWRLSNDVWELLAPAAYEGLLRRTIEAMEGRFPNRKEYALSLRADLATAMGGQGRTREEAAIVEVVLQGADDAGDASPEPLVHALKQAGFTLKRHGAIKRAEGVLQRALVAAKAGGLSPHNSEYQGVVANLSEIMTWKGQYAEAKELLAQSFAQKATGTYVLSPWVSLYAAEGDWERALGDLAEGEKVDSASPQWSGNRQVGTIERCIWKGNIQLAAGRVSQALATLEDVRAMLPRKPEAWQVEVDLLSALANVHFCVGDLASSYALDKEGLELVSTHTGPDEMAVQDWRINLSDKAWLLDRVAEAEALARGARDALKRIGRQDHALYATACLQLAEALTAATKLAEAERLNEEGLEAAKALYVRNAYVSGELEASKGAILLAKGNAQDAVPLLRTGISEMVKASGRSGNAEREAYYRRKLLSALAMLDSPDGLRKEIAGIIRTSKGRIELMSALSARERGEAIAGPLRQAEQVVALRNSHPQVIDDILLFEWFATMRAESGPLEIVRMQDEKPEVRKLHEDSLRAKQRVAAMSLSFVNIPGPEGEKLFQDAVADADAAHRKYAASLPPGTGFRWIQTVDLVPRLENALAIGIHRIRASPPEQKEDQFLGFTLDDTGKPRVIPLGPAKPIEDKIAAWRRAVTHQERGKPVTSEQPDPKKIGAELRAAVLDPLLKDAKAKLVYLCLDDALQTIPWDVLPAAPEAVVAKVEGAGGAKAGPDDASSKAKLAQAASTSVRPDDLVGDQYSIIELASFRELLDDAQRPLVPRQPSLLALGGIDYSAAGANPAEPLLADRPMRGRAENFGWWQKLSGSAEEVKGIRASFEEIWPERATLLTEEKATKKALFELARGATYLHVSTHGYGADDVATNPEDRGGADSQVGPQCAVSGFAPLSLCGLVLAGANREVSAREDVVGIATAEELEGLDLSNCQLAVLSGCQTNLGVRRAGQDLASLKSAFHAAGARNVIASLWKVPDSETSKLMQHFYECLWKKKMSPDEALWEAKSSMRKQPLHLWAGWVFSGVPQGK